MIKNWCMVVKIIIKAAESLDRMIRCHMKDLKTTKIAREGEEPKGPQTSPAEWASALLEKVSEAAAKKIASVTWSTGRTKRATKGSPKGAKQDAERKKPKKSADNTRVSKRKSAKNSAFITVQDNRNFR